MEENEQVKEEIERVREEHDQVEEEQEKLKEQLEKLKKEHDAFLLETVAGDVLSRKVQMTFIESDFQDNDDKVRYFTGLTIGTCFQSCTNLLHHASSHTILLLRFSS